MNLPENALKFHELLRSRQDYLHDICKLRIVSLPISEDSAVNIQQNILLYLLYSKKFLNLSDNALRFHELLHSSQKIATIV